MIYSGVKLFNLKATHGVPLDIALSALLDQNIRVNWVEFIDTARRNKWWDFQTLEAITDALEDAGYVRSDIHHITLRVKAYMLANKIKEVQ